MNGISRMVAFAVLLAGLATPMLIAPEAHAQGGLPPGISIPSSVDPGAIMNSNYNMFRLQRQAPYLFYGPVTGKDTQNNTEPLIIDEQGVLNQKSVRGTIYATPNGEIEQQMPPH